MKDRNSIPLGINIDSGRVNITVYKMDAGSFLLQNNESGKDEHDRVQFACSSMDQVDNMVKQILDEVRDLIKTNASGMENKWEAIDIFVEVEKASDGIEEDVELATDVNLSLDQVVELVNELQGLNPIIKNKVFGQDRNRGMGYTQGEILQAMAQITGKSGDIVNRPRLKPNNKKGFFYPSDKSKTKFGNKMPDNNRKEDQGGREVNEPTKIVPKEDKN